MYILKNKFNKLTVALLCIIFFYSTTSISQAKVYYLNPQQGSLDNNGSMTNPWPSLQEVIEAELFETQSWETLPYEEGTPLVTVRPEAPIKPGDTLLLQTGNHGHVFIMDAHNIDYITVAADDGQSPQFESLQIRSGSKWKFENLSIHPSDNGVSGCGSLIFLENHGWRGPSYNIHITGCSVYSIADSSSWGIDEWNNNSCTCMNVTASNVTITNNHCKNVNHGILISNDDAYVGYNVVENFAGDGLRGNGDYGIFEYNTIKNCYDVNENHDDGFQSFSVGDDGVGTSEVVGVELRGNTILNYEDFNQNFRGTLQGIGCFDGFFTDWVIENNLVAVDHWHGITLLGARDSKIVNNTVVDLNNQSPGPPWISISDHKDGRSSENCIIANNIASSLSYSDSPSMMVSDNIILESFDSYTDHFQDYTMNDYFLVPSSPAVDAANADYAPGIDHDRIYRPQGESPDIGAFEYYEDTPQSAPSDQGCDCNSAAKPLHFILPLLLLATFFTRRR